MASAGVAAGCKYLYPTHKRVVTPMPRDDVENKHQNIRKYVAKESWRNKAYQLMAYESRLSRRQ